MQTFLSCAVPASSAKKSCFYLAKGSLTSAIQVWSTLGAFLLKFRNPYQRNHHAKCQYLKSSYFVAVEKKREVGRASEGTETYTEPATSEFYHKFILIMIKCVGPIWAINLVCFALCWKVKLKIKSPHAILIFVWCLQCFILLTLFYLFCSFWPLALLRFELLRNVDARQMALNVNLPENMKGRTLSWGKQRVLFWAQVVFEGKRPS